MVHCACLLVYYICFVLNKFWELNLALHTCKTKYFTDWIISQAPGTMFLLVVMICLFIKEQLFESTEEGWLVYLLHSQALSHRRQIDLLYGKKKCQWPSERKYPSIRQSKKDKRSAGKREGWVRESMCYSNVGMEDHVKMNEQVA